MPVRITLALFLSAALGFPASAQPTAAKVRLGPTVSGPKVSPGDFAGKAVVLKLWGRH